MKDTSGLDAWKARVGEEEAERQRNRGATRGKLLHGLMEDWIDGKEPDFPTPFAAQLFFKIAKVYNNVIERVEAVEIALYSDELKIAGTCDLVAIMAGLGIAVADNKTSNGPKRKEWISGYFMQAAFYAHAWMERTGEKVEYIVIVVANEEDADAQVFVERYDDWIGPLRQTIDNFYQMYGEQLAA